MPNKKDETYCHRDERGYNQGFVPSYAMTIRSERRAEKIINEFYGSKSDIRVLEIGCGTGELSHSIAARLPGARITGLDLSGKFIEAASTSYKLTNLDYTQGDLLSPGFTGSAKYDYIIGNGILHHLNENIDLALEKLQSFLKPRGKLVFWEPNLYNPYIFAIFTWPLFRKLARLEPKEMAFTRRFITKKLSAAQYQNICVQYRDFLLPNTPKVLVSPAIFAGAILERTTMLSWLSQSLFISATKP